MKAHRVEQLLHGYRRGHEQLAGSVKLSIRDADLITRLSDLSGSLFSAPEFGSYLTIYPLPSGTYFAVGRTWPDPSATRAGCVLTQTLLVPVPLWNSLEDPRILDTMFFRPSSRVTDRYSSPIVIPMRHVIKQSELEDVDQRALLTFVHRYFGDGKRPLVWFGQERSEEILWRLLRGLWPRLRSTFSACTFCLQPRMLESRPFQLMFAPTSAYPRFLKLKPEHIIDAARGLQADAGDESAERWCRAWTSELFGRKSLSLPRRQPDLWAQLDEDPTAIRRLLLIEALSEGNSSTPQVFVGAMDLVASIAKDPEAALDSKRRVTERAVRTAREVRDPADGLECFRLIEDRLRRNSFAGVQDQLGPVLSEAVATLTQKFPDAMARSFVISPAGPAPSESWIGRGLLQGARRLALDEPERVLVFRNAPTFASYVLTTEPDVGAAFIRAAAVKRRDPDIRADLLRWLAGLSDHDVRSGLRVSLLPMLGSDDVDILRELLKDLRTEEVDALLDTLWLRTKQFETSAVRELVIEQIAHGYPVETRAWTHRLAEWAPITAQVRAATYPPTRQGLLELLDAEPERAGAQKAETVAAFLRRLGPGHYPYWLTDIAREHPSLLSTLLETAASTSVEVTEETERLLIEVPSLPVAHSPSLLRQVLHSRQRPLFARLLDVTMRSLIPGFVTGAVSEVAGRQFQEDPAVRPWFETVDPGDLRSLLIRNARSSTLHWLNAWRWTTRAPATLYAREPTVLLELIDALSHSHNLEWSQQISDMWSEILHRTRSQAGEQRTRMVLCVQALRFAFENTHLPLSAVVVEAFRDVYAGVTDSATFPLEAASLFGFFDWDKGKELRRALVDSFVGSQWPPGDLVLAVTDVWLLRKVFKRLMRMAGGESYAHAALKTLEGRTDPNADTLVRALRDMLTNKEFYEEWD